MLEKSTLIEHIQQINRSARSDWLNMFDPESLCIYLDNLQRTQEPRGGASRWVRRASPPAVTRKPVH